MTITVKAKTGIVVPDRVRQEAGIKTGDQVEFRVSGGVINIIPRLRSSGGEYTPEQRRIIDARLAKSDDDIEHGRVYGPFATAEELAASIEADIGKERVAKRRLRPAR